MHKVSTTQCLYYNYNISESGTNTKNIIIQREHICMYVYVQTCNSNFSILEKNITECSRKCKRSVF